MEKLQNFTSATTCEEVAKAFPEEVEKLEFQTVIVTGASSGLGLHTAGFLASIGANVVMACRNVQKAEEARILLQGKYKDKHLRLHILEIDLCDFEGINKFVHSFETKSKENFWPPLSILLCNAGIFSQSGYQVTADGFCRTFQSNHLGHFKLAKLLLPLLREKKGRIIFVSSNSNLGPLVSKNLTEKDEWMTKVARSNTSDHNGLYAYGTSKLCNRMMAMEFYRRETQADTGVTACSVDPGSFIATEVARESRFVNFFVKSIASKFTKTIDQGAANFVAVCLLPSPFLVGEYYQNFQIAEEHELLKGKEGEKACTILWEISEECEEE